MNITQIEETVKTLVSKVLSNEIKKDDFWFELMSVYGHRKTTISRIKSGERNLATIAGEVRAKRHIYFKNSNANEVLSDIDSMKKEPSVTRDKIRFVIATDFIQFVALDTRTHDTLDIEFNELGKYFDFFLPWAGMEKAVYQGENPADVKAAEKMAKLFDLIKADNFNEENKSDTAALHNLNVFLTRLLFCFFAEDTGIFKQNQFSAELESHTKLDGSDVEGYLNRLFDVLNTSKDKRGELPEYLTKFEYVNGDLFSEAISSPKFSTKSRKILIECGSELDWSDINPDIFGSMIQAVVHPDQRGGMGMHYTSVTNIMKVIEPLFLDDLYAELENIEDNIDAKLIPSRLRKLHDRVSEIQILDPACGSGNFLIIAFKELRKLEMEIIKRLQELGRNDHQDDIFGDTGVGSYSSRIKLSQFYGIELDDFAHEVAILSLWLAEHQMNVEFKAEFGDCEPSLPLKASGNILNSNALWVDWMSFCPVNKDVYILGNPPYLGGKYQSKGQKSDMANVFKGIKKFGELDYIGSWFYKAAQYVNQSGSTFAFVSTNSICQGSQVSQLWPHIFDMQLNIVFAHKTFVWSNNAKSKAAVFCVIIGVNGKSENSRTLYDERHSIKVDNINAYLGTGSNIIVNQSLKPISDLPTILTGNSPYDGGHLILTAAEKEGICREYPAAEKFMKRLYGSQDFLNGKERWCIWLDENSYKEAKCIEPIKLRVESVKESRLKGGEVAKGLTKRPYSFRYTHQAKNNLIIIPRVSSQRRKYIPFGFLGSNSIVSDSAQAIYDPELWVFGVLTSEMHMTWVRLTAGRLKGDYRYSSALCYNTFPLPTIDDTQKSLITDAVINIIDEREKYPDKTLAKLYDPVDMPDALKTAHYKLDSIIDKIYINKKFKSEEHRINTLLSEYEKMTGGQNA